jgi:hypothetical protein
MASKKLPSIQWYPGDWRKDPGIQALDYESRGVWFEMLMLMYESEERGKLVLNGQKMPTEALAHILGLEQAKVEQIVSKLVSYGVASVEQNTGIIFNRRMSNDEALRAVRAEAGAKGGKQTQSKNQANVKQKSTPSSSSSSSTTKTKNLKDMGGKKFKPPTVEEVRAYCLERKNGIDPERFIAFYESKGWMIGKNKMKSWKSAVITWEKSRDENHGTGNGQSAQVSAAKRHSDELDRIARESLEREQRERGRQAS